METNINNEPKKLTTWEIIIRILIAIAGVLTGATAKAMNLWP